MEVSNFLDNLSLKNLMSFLNNKVIIIREYVRYYEVDKMQVVHHSNYFRYYELIRCFYFTTNILPYSILENEYKIYSPLLEASSKYIKKLNFEDIFFVSCFIDKIELNKIYFRYFIIKEIDTKDLFDLFDFIKNNKKKLVGTLWYYNYLKSNYKKIVLQNLIAEGTTIHTFVDKDFKLLNLKNIYIPKKNDFLYNLLKNLEI